ncbi:MAG: RNA polymerase sigma factor [Alphaproteobacteria bacterium]|nr:RNA polymerase sigma factor [Alphaproteobacteria bacterium]
MSARRPTTPCRRSSSRPCASRASSTRTFGLRAWLFRVTTNLCYNIVRDKRAARRHPRPHARRVGAPQGSCPPPRELVVYASCARDELLGAMTSCPEDHRRILLLRYYQDLSYSEIAEELDIKLGTVMSAPVPRAGKAQRGGRPRTIPLVALTGPCWPRRRGRPSR